MKLSNRKPLFLALALTVAAPLAFAQSTQYPQSTAPTAAPTTEAQSATPTAQDATNAATQAATGTQNEAMSSTSEPKKVNWSDLDANKNGTLSASEAASVSTLAKAFGEADANADGELTQDEYKAYLAAAKPADAPKSDSGG
jgi:hypothetical protein